MTLTTPTPPESECMNFRCTLPAGQVVELGNEGERTSIHVKSAGQTQGTTFTTGRWSKQPRIFETEEGAVVQFEVSDARRYIEVRNGAIASLKTEPDLHHAQEVELEEVGGGSHIHPMEPLRPMEPMKPLKPLEQS